MLKTKKVHDDVEVVRCKDCEFYQANYRGAYEKGDGRCDHPQMCCEDCYDAWLETHPDSFCSYGERKESE